MNSLMFAAADGGDLVSVVCWIAALALICGLLWWLVDYVKTPEPFNRVAKAVIAVVGVIALIKLIVKVLGNPF